MAEHQLSIWSGQYSDKGRKSTNQDFHGICIPPEPQLTSKGIAIALADGISSSEVSHLASQAAVGGFLEDYYCTSEAWSVKTSAERVLVATNAWLHSQTQQSHYRFDKDRGYVCTLSVMVIKSRTAHIFHIGDSRIYRLRGQSLEQLTRDHRVWISQDQSYLGRAMGVTTQLEIDYQTLAVEVGDIFLLATDGVYEFADPDFMVNTLHGANVEGSAVEAQGALELTATTIGNHAYQKGSNDNLTVQVVRIVDLPDGSASEIQQQLSELRLPPVLEARMELDGYRIVRELHGSSRSHIYLAVDIESNKVCVLKTPSIDLQGDAAYLERFLMEEWVARRINSAHVLKPFAQTRKRNYLYVVTEFIEGQTLAQWRVDNPHPDLATVRGLVGQIVKGLQAFHRMDMLHQDLRPENIMIDTTGTARIIDFGSTRVAGVAEVAGQWQAEDILGTPQYTAPEYFLGEVGTPRSDLFSLGVITYQLLTGRLPYGAEVAKTHTRLAQRNLQYQCALDEALAIPAWIDGVLKKAVHPDPDKRYSELSEFLQDLRQPNQAFLNQTRAPLLERNPLIFWKSVSLLLALAVIVLVALRPSVP